MKLFCSVLIVLLMLFGPRLMVLLSSRYRFFGLLGPVFLCYATGFLLSLVLPDTSIAMSISEILVPVAIPLILFSADLASAKRLAKPTLVSFALMCVSVMAVAVASFFVFRSVIPQAGKYAGMIIGLYTGGTPNLMAIGMALGVDESNIVLANTVDLVVGGVYFLLLISFVPRVVGRLLPNRTGTKADAAPSLDTESDEEKLKAAFVPGKLRFSFRALLARVPILLLAILCLAAAAGIALLVTGKMDVAVIMLVVTTLGIGLSFVRKVREAPGSYAAGQYLIYMFSFGIGLSFDIGAIQAGMLHLLAMFALAQFGAVILHLLLAAIFRIDGATAVITSTAGVYGPAFIVPVANALKNDAVILPGLICGIIGYAIGNYLGIGMAYFLSLF